MGRPSAVCPGCKGAERHRLLWLYLERETDIFFAPKSVLHVAPERTLASRLEAVHKEGYVSGDLDSPIAMESLDVTAIRKPDAAFDLVVCSHVLEHVHDDIAAMREFHRVLRPSGMAIMQHPIDDQREKTYEDPTITTRAGRRRAYLQGDHVRVYGRDFHDRLESVGFSIEVVKYRGYLTRAELDRFGLIAQPSGNPLVDRLAGDDIYICRRD